MTQERPQTYWGTARVGAELGVSAGAVSKWIERYATTACPFPTPDVEITEPDGRVTRGWAPDRMNEIWLWHKVDRLTVRRPGNPGRPLIERVASEDMAVVDGQEITASAHHITKGPNAGIHPTVIVRNADDGTAREWDADKIRTWAEDLRTHAVGGDTALADALETAANRAEQLARGAEDTGA